MRTFILTLLTLFVVLVLGVAMADSAFAFHPLFLTVSGKALSFTATSELTVLRALNLGVLGTIDCENGTSSGQILSKSTLELKVELEYSGKCEQTIGATKTACTEPIKFKLTFGELGLNSKKVVLLLAPESGTEFAKVTCGSNTSTVEGAVVAEFPETNASSQKQYNTTLSPLELVFKSEGKNENQAITSIELSGVSMTKAELKISGFFGGKASLESTQTITPDAGTGVLICTLSPAACKAPLNIIFTQFKGNNAGKCPENAAKNKVEFKVVTEWCEYKVKNEEQLEEVTITGETEFERAGCVFAGEVPEFCVEFVAPVEKQCTQNLKLLAGAECFSKLEYKKRPTVRPNGMTFTVKLKSPAGEEAIFKTKLILN